MLIYKLLGYILVERMYKYLYSESKGFSCWERTLRECYTHSWMVWQNAGKGRWQSRRVLNVKDLRRQTTANEEKFVISASANGDTSLGIDPR